MVASTWYFDSYYLKPDHEKNFDPIFYDFPPVETPEMHWDLSRQWATSRMNISIMPRGSAKTTHCQRDMIMRLVSFSGYSFCYATSTHDNAKHTGQRVRDQCYENDRVQDDFGPEYGGFLKPSRGSKSSGVEYFYLTNNSYLRCVSAESRLRGIRPVKFRLDDPEYDEKASTSMSMMRDYTQRLVFNLAVPMVLRARAGIDWTGTFVSKKHLLWHAMATIQTPEGVRAADPRFDRWDRLFQRGAWHEDGVLRSCWPAMWPATIAEKEAAGLQEHVSVEEMPSILGSAVYRHEFLGDPGSADEQFFHLDTEQRGRHAYWFENVDGSLSDSPTTSSTLICYRDPNVLDGQDLAVIRTPLSDFLRSCRLFVTVDTAYTENAASDRRCCHLLACHKKTNILFSLALWSDRKPDSVLVDSALRMAQLWRAPTLFVEVVKDSFKLYKRFQSVVSTRLTQEMGLTFVPAVRDIRPGTMTKTAKIETLDLRFEHSLVKLPLWKRHHDAAYTRLFDQIEQFNPEVKDGGLEKDDELDTMSMSLLVLKGRQKKDAPSAPEVLDPIASIKSGKFLLPGGAAIGMGLPWQLIDPEITNSLLVPAHIDAISLRTSSKKGKTRV